MSKKLPSITSNEVIKVLEKSGFFFSRQSGSHKIYKNNASKRITLPFYTKKILHPKILKHILEIMDITVDEFK
ncbi:MAG: type II toxin-antitoxin system HicA family toxin [Spirochaetales bacterium]|nr:type II toxin-antitoxin system HicA family toxin [Spirochaetales bacterium]